MDELTIDGKTYLSSKRAAKVAGYAKDYIGQLCREGRVEAKLVGRSWYVYEPSLKEHRFNDERVKKGKQNERGDFVSGTYEVEEGNDGAHRANQSDIASIEAVWERPTYSHEPVESIPELDKKEDETGADPISEMQSAWQDWFSGRKEERREKEPVQEAYALPKSQPVRMSVREVTAPEEVVVRRTGAIGAHWKPYMADIRPVEEEIQRNTAPIRPRKQIRERRKGNTGGNMVANALVVAGIVLVVSVTVVATGILETLHLGGAGSTNVINFFQGTQTIEK